MRKKKGNELPSLPPTNLPYKEESEWLDRLFDSFLQEKISLDDLKKGVVLVFHSYGKSEEGNQESGKSGVEDGAAEGGGTLRWRLDEYGG